MTQAQHATYLKDVSLKKRGEDEAQILAWANDVRDKLYQRCEAEAKLGRMYLYVNEIDLFIPTGVPTDKIAAVFNKVQNLFNFLGYKVDIGFNSAATVRSVSSIKINWEDSK